MEDHWDAAAYDRVSAPQLGWGGRVLERLDLRGDEVVLDAGCGTGRVTERLEDRLPGGRVVALDRSPGMAALARRRLRPERASVLVADLAARLPIRDGALDAVFSTAVLHWVPRHDRLFAELARVLRPGGRLVAQCGGAGNAASVVDALARQGNGWRGPWNHPGAAETGERLVAAGFTEVSCWLHDEPTRFASREAFREFLETVVVWPFLERLPEEERPGFTDRVLEQVPGCTLDNVRLNIVARYH